jgi:hypothetical protein
MSRLSPTLRRHDPYWDMDGAGARQERTRQRLVRLTAWVAVVAVLAIVVTRLPTIDPAFLLRGEGRPLLAGALMTILGSAALLALARVRHLSRS